MNIACPFCNQRYDVDDSAVGATVSCVTCEKDFTVPSSCMDSQDEKRCVCGARILVVGAVKCNNCKAKDLMHNMRAKEAARRNSFVGLCERLIECRAVIYILGFPLVIGAIILIGFACDPKGQAVVHDSGKRSEKVMNSEWDGSVSQVKEYLKRNLKDPSSYESIDWSVVSKTNSGYSVIHKFRSKNSFGGYSTECVRFEMDNGGSVVSATTLE